MAGRARALFEELRRRYTVEHDDSGQIGRRYRRQDEIGTPWAFTIDEQTLEDETVTVRDRDSLAQERLPISGVGAWLEDALRRPWRSPKEDAASPAA
jgi:glycyl-tRNA synthetase